MSNSNRVNTNLSLSTSDRMYKSLVLAIVIVGVLTLLLSLGTSAHAQSARFNAQQIGDALTSYGKNTVNNNGHIYYTVVCGHDSWKSSVTVSLSPNSAVIWMDLDLVEVPSRVSPAALANLLRKNADLGPVFFSINNNWLRVSLPLPNSEMSESKLKANLEHLVNLAVDNHDVWDPRVLASVPSTTHGSGAPSSMQHSLDAFDRSLQAKQ